MRPARGLRALVGSAGLLVALAGGCKPSPRPTPSAGAAAALAQAESVYADLRAIRDRIDISTAAGHDSTPDGAPLADAGRRHNALRDSLSTRLAAIPADALTDQDARALIVMRAALDRDVGPVAPPAVKGPVPAEPAPDCRYDPRAIATGPGGLDSLRQRIYACYGWAQHHVAIDGTYLDRLTILHTIGRSAEPGRRRQLFLALGPMWRSVNGDDGAESPYRVLIGLEAARRGRGSSPLADRAAALGLNPDSLEHWLVTILEAWRESTPDTLLEPWNWYYESGRASRILSPRISAARLTELNAAVFRSLGADPAALNVRYDLAARDGKTPVAFTTFGARPRFRDSVWAPGQPWVFATYRTGGLDNLNELLHETGHAVHIAAIHTRPAFADWPDSDPFTEALGDFIALDVYEPAWQQHWLGDSVPLADGLRGRYAGVVLDVAWALFEVRMLRDPASDPNQVWTAITSDYLRIKPHPEWSWWAMRGQLVDAPGYMMNYAVGSILIAAIRARTREAHGDFVTGDSTWYAWVAPRLYRFGLERPSRQVIEDFLGRPVSPDAMLADMRRMSAGGE